MDRRRFLRSSLAGSLAFRSLAVSGAGRAQPRFGCASITWDGNDPQAIDDIAAAGYRGIQLRAAAVDRWRDRPEALKALLAERGLTFVALSSGVAAVDPARQAESLALHTANARFLQAAGGKYLQVVDERPRNRPIVTDDYRRMGRHLTDIGSRIADFGIALGLHNHMGNLSQAPDEVARVLDAADPRVVHLELDIAHWQAAGGDPVQAVRDYAKRILFLHLKDLQRPAPGGATDSYRFVELGQGSVDVRGVLSALDRTGFTGWTIVELDSVPAESGRTAADSARLSRRYLESIGYTL